MDGSEAIDTADLTPLDIDDAPAERDYEAEARKQGWTPQEDFRGDPARWTYAETFVKRADEVMPFLQKQNKALKRELDDLRRQVKKSTEFFTQAETRAYERAMADLQKRHDEAVETGDLAASRRVMAEMRDIKPPEAPVADAPVNDADAATKFAEWIDANDWYVKDADRRSYADIQAQAMGPAIAYDGGPEAWLEELGRRVERKFTAPKPNAANPGGNRAGARGGKAYSDLPPEAKAVCDKWVRQGIIKSRDDYVKSYQW